ncbi:RHS repeat-associated core domain-containing protein, partial [Mariprofundus sp. EBB-1]|uniref:RHS repeat-associated core domain-containing protein n=1 Tax=Mariprofundus sp. EBB-1 TaxID=2650971 RepID=UPI001F31F764
MNARLYDPVLGRFISADTVVPDAGNMQAFNRYSYVDNNPLKYTDPSGHFKLGNLWNAVKPVVAIAAAAVVMAVTGNPMLAGAIAGYINTGNLTGAIMGGISGAFFAGAGEIGDTFGTFAGIAANGTSGGLMSMMN